MKLVAIVFLISLVIDATFANTAKIDFSKEASSKQVKDAVLGIKIPDQSGKEKGINYRSHFRATYCCSSKILTSQSTTKQ